MVKGYLAGAVSGLVLYLILIPRFSYFGAAIGTIATEIIVAVIAFWLVRQGSKQSLSLKIILKSFPALIALIAFFHFVTMPWAAEALIGLALYTVILLLSRAIPTDFVKEVIYLRSE